MHKIIMVLGKEYNGDVRVYREAIYLKSLGYEIEVLSWDRENNNINTPIENIEGIKVIRFYPYSRYGTGIKQILPYLRFVLLCVKYIKSNHHEYLHCHDLDGMLVGLFIKGKSKIVFDMHEIYESQTNNKKIKMILRILTKSLVKVAYKVVYVNEVQKNALPGKFADKFVYLPNYPNVDMFGDVEKTESSSIRISYIGKVRQYEELKNLIDVCKELKNIKVFIHGDGIAYEKLFDYSADLDNIVVSGKYNFQQSSLLYSETDILYAVYPTSNLQNRLSYPIKLFESIITKTPIIVSKNTKMEQFVLENDIGFVVDESDVNNIKCVIEKILADISILELKKKNIEKIQYNYTWEAMVNNLKEIYDIKL